MGAHHRQGVLAERTTNIQNPQRSGASNSHYYSIYESFILFLWFAGLGTGTGVVLAVALFSIGGAAVRVSVAAIGLLAVRAIFFALAVLVTTSAVLVAGGFVTGTVLFAAGCLVVRLTAGCIALRTGFFGAVFIIGATGLFVLRVVAGRLVVGCLNISGPKNKCREYGDDVGFHGCGCGEFTVYNLQL